MKMRRWAGLALGIGLTLSLATVAHGATASGATPFDVEAATRAYLDVLKGPARERSDAYFEGGYWLILWNAVVAIAANFLLLPTRWSAGIRSWAERVSGGRRWLTPALYAWPYFLFVALVSLPYDVWTNYAREKQYGLLNQSFGAWFSDYAMKTLVAGAGVMIFLLVIFAVIRAARRSWWLWGAGVMTLLAAGVMLIAPLFIMPLFNSFTEMPAGPLRDRIVAMAKAKHIPADHIYVSDASRQSNRISANVSGLGPTVRITLNDTLLKRTGEDEVLAVLGHEMGHYALGHVWRNIIAFGLIFLALFAFTAWGAPRVIVRGGARWGIRDLSDPAATPVLMIFLTLSGLILTPLQNNLIRADEIEADAFGLDVARQPDGFAKVAMRLSEYRKIEPGAVEEFLFFDHPSGRTRVHMAMQWKKDHVPGATTVHPDLKLDPAIPPAQ